jgi:hypothetical protein
MASSSPPKVDALIFTNHVVVPLVCEQLDSKNYASWASHVRLWLVDQDYEDHRAKPLTNIDETNWPQWRKVDAQLYCILKSILHPTIRLVFRAHETCASIWAQADTLYTNSTQRLYGICSDLLTILGARWIDDSMATYLGMVSSLLQYVNELLPRLLPL